MTSISPVHAERSAACDDAWTTRRAVRSNSPAAVALALAAAATALATTTHPDIPLAAAIIVVALLPAVLADVAVRRLPNRLVGGAAMIGLAATAISLVSGANISLVDGIIGAAVTTVPLLVAHVISPQSMGFGDVKFAFVIGAAVGLVDPMAAIGALAVGSLGTSIHGMCTRQRSVAFGPGLLGGAVVMLALVALDPFGGSPTQVLVGLGRTH